MISICPMDRTSEMCSDLLKLLKKNTKNLAPNLLNIMV